MFKEGVKKMDENNCEQQTVINEEKHENWSWLKTLLLILAVFLGAFCAFYTVADWHFKRVLNPAYQMRKFDRELINQQKMFDKMQKNDFKIREKINMEQNGNQFVRTEKLDDAYRITIDLKQFDNNPENVKVRTEGKMLLIDAVSEKKSKNRQQIAKYSQAFAFGDDIKENEITKVHEGTNYIITVPID